MVNTKLLAVVLIVAIVGGGAGVYLFFAMPGPIYSTPVSISGLLVTEEYEFGVPFPNSQMQVVLEITDNSGVCSFTVLDKDTADVVYSSGALPSSGIKGSPWLPVSGWYTIVLSCVVGELTGTFTVYARGVPFIT